MCSSDENDSAGTGSDIPAGCGCGCGGVVDPPPLPVPPDATSESMLSEINAGSSVTATVGKGGLNGRPGDTVPPDSGCCCGGGGDSLIFRYAVQTHVSSLSVSLLSSFAETLDDISELPRWEVLPLADAILLLWPRSPPPPVDTVLLVATGNFSLVDDRAFPLDPDGPPLLPPAARRIVQFNETRQLGFFDLV